MVTVTIKTSTTRVLIVEPNETVLTVPYGADRDPRERFVDLREAPGRIDQIEALQRRPALREQIELLNRRGPFMTFACSSWTTRLFQHTGPSAWRTSSRVRFAFVGAARRGLRRYVPLARAFLDVLDTAGRADRWNSVIELQPARFVFGADCPVWSMTIRTSGYGLDTRTAMLEWDLCARAQTELFRSRIWRRTPDRIDD